MGGNGGTQSRTPAEPNGAELSGPIESEAQAAGAFDGSARMEADDAFRNMSTPRTGSLGLVKHAVPLNKRHLFQLR